MKFRDALRKRLAEATPGIWRSGQKVADVLGGSTEQVPSVIGERNGRLIHIEEQCVTFRTYHLSRADADFIANAKSDVEILLHELEKAEAVLGSFRYQLIERIKLCPPHSSVVFEFKAYLSQTNEALASLRAVLDASEEK